MKLKLLLPLVLLLSLPVMAFSQSTVSGVVTYYFNEFQGDKPDLGAKVYLVDTTKIEGFDPKVVQNFTYAKAYRHLYASSSELYNRYLSLVKKTEGKKRQKAEYDKHKASLDEEQQTLNQIKAQLVRFGAETDEKFEALDEEAMQMLRKIKEDNSSQKTVDANGNYSFNVSPGTYYVYMTSKNRTGLSLTEVLGMVYLKKVTVAENESKDVSHNFELYLKL